MTGLLLALVVSTYFLVPVGIVWGWIRCFRNSNGLTRSSALSLIGFGLATASALLVAGTAVYAGIIGGFQFYDPRLKLVFRTGILLTGSSFLISLVGIAKKNPLRWFAPACSTGMGVIWFYLLLAE